MVIMQPSAEVCVDDVTSQEKYSTDSGDYLRLSLKVSQRNRKGRSHDASRITAPSAHTRSADTENSSLASSDRQRIWMKDARCSYKICHYSLTDRPFWNCHLLRLQMDRRCVGSYEEKSPKGPTTGK